MVVYVAGFAIVLAVLVVWLGLLTAGLLRWRHERGNPVYRRLPDGRLRFEWGVHVAYHSARRAAAPQTGPGLTDAPSSVGPGPSTSLRGRPPRPRTRH